jgi:hypothetical protein
LGSFIVIYVVSGYATIMFRGLIPIPLYCCFPSLMLGGLVIVKLVFYCCTSICEDSDELLKRWGRRVVIMPSRKYFVRKLRATTSIRFHGTFMNHSLFYLKRSTMLCVGKEIVAHIANTTLSFPTHKTSFGSESKLEV